MAVAFLNTRNVDQEVHNAPGRAPEHGKERKTVYRTLHIRPTRAAKAEAAGIGSTGIGCYFDDVFHDLLGIQSDAFQCLYHFTVGNPVDDARLTTLEPYFHLDRQKA
jgi:hypothetical protein